MPYISSVYILCSWDIVGRRSSGVFIVDIEQVQYFATKQDQFVVFATWIWIHKCLCKQIK